MEVVGVDSLWVTIYGQPGYVTFGSHLLSLSGLLL